MYSLEDKKEEYTDFASNADTRWIPNMYNTSQAIKDSAKEVDSKLILETLVFLSALFKHVYDLKNTISHRLDDYQKWLNPN